MLRVAICGGSGYTGAELLRLLSGHKRVRVVAVTSERSAGKSPADLYGNLYAYRNLKFQPLQQENLLERADLFFMTLPHGASQAAVDFFYRSGKKVIDLSADFRLKDPLSYEQWYGVPHNFRGTLRRAVYGLPELGLRDKIKKATLIANPGCYPTGALLGLYPALKGGLVKKSSPIILDSKSGTSGAGRKANQEFAYCGVNEDLRAYAIGTHRHTPEIEQGIATITRTKTKVNFTPHLVPMDRGILSTIYLQLKNKTTLKEALGVFRKVYAREPFVRVLGEGAYPSTKDVRGSNFCDIGLQVDTRTGTLVVVTAIDNLVKGASGAAVQNMNLMMGFKETTALEALGLNP